MSADKDADRRQSPRIKPDREDTIRVRLPWYGGQQRESPCIVTDASAEGLGILMSERLTNGSTIQVQGEIHIGGAPYSVRGGAEVVSSRMGERGLYRIGLRFVDVIWERSEARESSQTPVDQSVAESNHGTPTHAS